MTPKIKAGAKVTILYGRWSGRSGRFDGWDWGYAGFRMARYAIVILAPHGRASERWVRVLPSSVQEIGTEWP